MGLFVKMFDSDVCLYCEGYGPKIHKGGKYSKTPDFVLFDVKISNIWLQRKDVVDIANKLGIQVVPRVGIGTLHHMVNIAKQGFKSHWGDFQVEGIVAKPLVALQNRQGNRSITKIKCADFKKSN